MPGYVLAQCAVTVAVAALFIFTQKNMVPATRYLLAAWIAAGVVAGGGLLENRPWAWRLELALLWGSPWLPVAAGMGGVAARASAGWFYKLRAAGVAAVSAAGATA